jgi:Domain of unknown function (DUF6430)
VTAISNSSPDHTNLCVNNILLRISIYFVLLRKVSLRRLTISFSSIFGGIWLFLEPASFFIPDKLKFGLSGYLVLIAISLLLALLQNFPRTSLGANLTSPDTEIEVKIGDIFREKGHIVIGTNDVFDTAIGEIIKDSSVQGQFLRQVYDNNLQQLDLDIESALQKQNTKPRLDSSKSRGKKLRYPISTVVTLGSHERRYFLLAYGRMGNDLTVESNSDAILSSLDTLWSEVRQKCHGTEVFIPIIGSDLARSGLSRMQLTKLIVSSFVLESKRRFITRKLVVMIYFKDLNSIDFYALKEFLKSACF